MKRKRFTEEQIVRILRDAERTQMTIQDFVKTQGVSEQTFYRWKKKYGGMDVSEARRLKELEVENMRLKKLVAEQQLSIEVLKEVNSKKW